ncbi:glycoside hydrolase family 27 [Pochonia chlamydosporia 170]|uniref:Alpha-galactosidase n=1 Tax=Pochonia chlamydosporia 170 TaxID=1380566 RepID=A0A179FLM0_METCM|nr:glycoside hydrolase family 27 [Pochonia chlamydosporia 170]OAQ66120.1 glycoside hydrolase family 27 [Pochonia chlamydosporia 170]
MKQQIMANSWSKLLWLGYVAGGAQATNVPRDPSGKLPTLGWNSWNAYHCDINEQHFLDAAKAMVDTGLRDAGYNYVNIDDCWSEKTGRVNGHMAVNVTRFPDGLDGLSKKIHDMKLKFGIYSTAGTLTCAGYPASLEYEDVDAADFAKWGVDYLKYDNCNVPSNWQDQYIFCEEDGAKIGFNGTCSRDQNPKLAPDGYDWSKSKSAERFNRMRDALSKQDREILYNLCIWGTADVFSWGKNTAISWRMSGDISPNWGSVMHILNMNSFKMNTVDFYAHNDADMLEVGNGDLTPAETRSHFALWAAMKSPLLIGTDLQKLSADNLKILKNKYLLAFNQDDRFGKPATPYKWGVNPNWTYNSTNPAEFWAGQSKNGHLVLMLNTLGGTVKKTAKWSEIPGLGGRKYRVTDVWSGKDLGCLKEYSADVAAHDTAAILVGRRC